MAGCPVIELCRNREEDVRFGFINPDEAAEAALIQALNGIPLTAYDYSNAANEDRPPFIPVEKPLDSQALLPEAVQIVCFGNPIASSSIRLTPESQGLLEAAVVGTGCWGNCNRFQAFKDYSAFFLDKK